MCCICQLPVTMASNRGSESIAESEGWTEVPIQLAGKPGSASSEHGAEQVRLLLVPLYQMLQVATRVRWNRLGF